MATTLEHVADAADEVARDHRQVARRARTMQRQRDRGMSWTQILDREGRPGIVELLRRTAKRTGEMAAAVGVLLAKGLAAEGESRRQIARRFGVTHQRVTALIRGRR